MHLWVEACNYAVYVQNCCAHIVLCMSTHEEYFTGKKHDISQLNIFGLSVYIHVTKDARKKLESAAKVGIFVWYIETPNNYLVYFPNSWMTVVRRDIKFNEEC